MKRLISVAVVVAVALGVVPAFAQVTPIQPDQFGRFISAGPLPTLSSCGTLPVVVGNDTSGKVTIGTGTPSACTLTFSRPFASAPTCYAVDETTVAKNFITVATTTSAAVMTLAAASVNGDVIAYFCMGR